MPHSAMKQSRKPSEPGGAKQKLMGKFYLETHLVNRVHRFHDSVLQKLEVTEFHRVVSAVVLQIFLAQALLESPSAGHGVPVHVAQLAVSGGGSVAG